MAICTNDTPMNQENSDFPALFCSLSFLTPGNKYLCLWGVENCCHPVLCLDIWPPVFSVSLRVALLLFPPHSCLLVFPRLSFTWPVSVIMSPPISERGNTSPVPSYVGPAYVFLLMLLPQVNYARGVAFSMSHRLSSFNVISVNSYSWQER